MDKGSFAAAELMVFLGLAGWLVYYQLLGSGKRSERSDESSGEASDKKDESAG